MNHARTPVLLIEDNAGDARLIKEMLTEAGTGSFQLERADRLSSGLASIDQGSPELVLLDLSLPDSEGLATVAAVRKHAPQLPVIVLTGHDDDSLAMAAVGSGAQDYLVKGRITGDSLDRAIRYAIERKRVADSLREVSIFNAVLLQTSPLGMDIVAEDGIILFVSPGLEALVGESPVGKRCWEVYRDDHQQCQDCPLKMGIEAGETRIVETLGVLGERDFEITHTGMVYRGRKAVLEVFHDITERRRSEEALRLSESRLRTIVEGTQALLMSVDANGRFTYANDATARTLGFASPEELMGKSYLHFIHPEDRQRVLDTFVNQANARQLSSMQEFRILDPEGKVKWYSFVSTLAVKDGQVVGQSGVAQDITERRQAENALRESEEQVGATFEQAAVGLAQLAADGTFLRFNQRLCDIVGYPREELVTKSFQDITHPDDVEDDVANLNRLLANEIQTYSKEKRYIRKNGSSVWVNLTVSVVREPAGAAKYLVSVIEDITERKQAEVEILRRAAQQAALNAILAAGIRGGADLEGLLNVAIDQTVTALGLEIGAIWIAPTGGRAHSFVMRGLPVDTRATMGQLAGSGEIPALESTVSDSSWSSTGGFADTMRLFGIKSTLTTPLLFGGRVIGGVSVASPTPREWKTDEVALVEAVGSQLGIVIERARLYEETRQRMDELEAVSRVSGALREAQSLQQILDKLLDETLATLGADSGGIWLHDPPSQQLRPAASRGWFADLLEHGLPANEGIAGATFAGAEAVVSREFRSDPRSRVAAGDQLPEGWGGACVPLRTSAEVVGVLFVSVRLPREIENQELRLLNTLAEIGGNAIHRTRLHEQTESQLMEAEALRDVERAVASSFDLSLTLGLVSKHATQLLGADASAVLVLSASTHDLEYAAWCGFHSRAPVRTRLGLAGSLAGRVAMERRMISVADPTHKGESGQCPSFYAAEGFVSYCGVPIIAKGALKGVLEVLHRSHLDAGPHWPELLTTLAGQAAIAIDNNSLFDGLQRSNAELTMAYEATLEGWSRALDLRDRETEGHSQRVTEMAVRLAITMGVPDADLVHVRRGALLHDIGKLGVPDQILLKPGKLTDEEWVIMRGHPLLAYDLLAPITYLNPALDIPYCHHEKWDGTGYPRQLRGEEIPLPARIFSVVDVWDALGSDRPYRPAWPREKIMAYMREQSGLHFDPRILAAFLTMQEQ
jgi:PAS domain S-box-containing protein